MLLVEDIKLRFLFVSANGNNNYAPITVTSHPPRLVVGEGGCPQQHVLWGFYCTCTHMCSPDLTKETALVEGGSYNCSSCSNPLLCPHLLPTWKGEA